MKQKIWVLVWLLCISAYAAAQGQNAVDPEKQGGLKGDVEPLRIVAQAHQANKDRIKTWRGRATIEVQVYREGKSSIEHWIESSVTFAYDRDGPATRWNYTRLEDRSSRDSKEIKINNKPYSNNGMKKDEVLYELFYYENQDQRRTMMIRPAHKADYGMYAENPDPMWYLTKGGENLSERLMFYYREANNPNLSRGTVECDGDKVILETRSGTVTNRYKFDLSLGGNLIAYYGADSIVTTRYYWTYEEFDDLWIPKSFTYINVSRREDGLWRNNIRRIEFVENVVNEPLAEDEFSFAKMGLRPGDRIYDGRTSIEYTFGQKGAMEADMPPRLIESIVGKPLPKFDGIDIEFVAQQAEGKAMLVCFFDMYQRPSRHLAGELAKKAEKLKEKGIVVICVQASKVERGKLDEWVKESKIPFIIGMIEGDEEKVRSSWGVKSLPWLILTDKEHVVITEGFGIEELHIEEKPTLGKAAPSFRLKRLDGKQIKLEDYRGKCVLLYFWATSCKPCVASTPRLKRFYTHLSRYDDFEMIGLSMDDGEFMRYRFLDKHKPAWPQVHLGLRSGVSADYGVGDRAPTYILIGPDGNILLSDERNWNKVKTVVEKTLPGKGRAAKS